MSLSTSMSMMALVDAESQPQASEKTGKFTLFPALPLELRRKIWACTFQPRVLEYRLSTTHIPGFVQTRIGYPKSHDQFRCIRAIKVPSVLHVCHESRSYALEHYILSSGGTEPPQWLQDYPGLKPRPVYFNPNIDVVGFESFQDAMEVPACWGPTRHAVRGSYDASPDFRDVKRLLLNATDWESVGVKYIAGKDCLRGPRAAFFTELFPALDEILLAQSFPERRKDRLHYRYYFPPNETTLSGSEVWLMRCVMDRDLKNVMAVKTPGWTAPPVRIVRSRRDMTEVMPIDGSLSDGSDLETEAIYDMIREHEGPPPLDYWTMFDLPAPE